MNKLTIAFLTFSFILALGGCKKADTIERNENNTLSDIYATIEGQGEKRLFNPRIEGETVYFDIPYYYPEESNNETDLTKIILRSTIPSDARVSPSLGVPMDISAPLEIHITSGTGEVQKYTIIGKKVGNVDVKKANIEFKDVEGNVQNVDAIIQGTNISFYVVPGNDLSNVTFTYSINRHASGSITNGGSVDLSKDQKFTVTGPGETSREYTIKALEPLKVDYGFGINRPLWTKSAAELNFADNMEVSIAVSGDHLVLLSRTNPAKYTVLNRMTGDVVGQMHNPFGSQLSFQIVGDQHGNILASSWAPKGAAFTLYRYENAMDQNPVKMLEWVNSNPTGSSADAGAGRRVNVYGDLKGNAVIMAHAGLTNFFYRWVVRNGKIENTTPQVVTYPDEQTLGYYPEGQPVSDDPEANFYLVYQKEVAYINGKTGAKINAFAPINGAVFNSSAAVAPFNGATYFAYVQYNWTYDLNRTQIMMYDVTNTARIGMSPSDASFGTFNVFRSEELFGNKNGNGTSDIAIGYSKDGERMYVYMLLTNGGILAHEFTKYSP